MAGSTIFTAFSPFFLMCLLMGNVTFRLRKSTVVTSWIHNLFPLVLICGYGYIFYKATDERFFSEKFDAPNSIETTTDCFQLLGSFMAQTATWIESIFAKRALMDAMKRLYDFDDVIIKRFKYDFRYNYWRSVCWLQLLAGFIFYCILINFILYAYMSRFGVHSVPVWITYAVPMGLSGLRYFQFINMVFIVKLRFAIINDELRTISETCRSQNGNSMNDKNNDVFKSTRMLSNPYMKAPISTISHGDQLFAKKHKNWKQNIVFSTTEDIKVIDVADRTDHPEVYYLSNFDTYKPAYPSQHKAKILNSNALIDRLAVLCELHDELCDICGLVDKSFSYSMLANIAVAFIATTSQLYLVFSILTMEDFANSSYTAASAMWILPCIVPLIMLCATCHLAVTEAKRTGPLLHKIQSEVTDERYKDFVDLFSLQLMHQTVKFSPCGFFDVDFTLLFAMTGAITTYLVILIQFHLSAFKEKMENTTMPITDLALFTTQSYLTS